MRTRLFVKPSSEDEKNCDFKGNKINQDEVKLKISTYLFLINYAEIKK